MERKEKCSHHLIQNVCLWFPREELLVNILFSSFWAIYLYLSSFISFSYRTHSLSLLLSPCNLLHSLFLLHHLWLLWHSLFLSLLPISSSSFLMLSFSACFLSFSSTSYLSSSFTLHLSIFLSLTTSILLLPHLCSQSLLFFMLSLSLSVSLHISIFHSLSSKKDLTPQLIANSFLYNFDIYFYYHFLSL